MRANRALRGRALALIVAGGLAGPASAHQRPIAIEQWGPFLPRTAACLRALSRVGQSCFHAVLQLRDRCEVARMQGQERCDAVQLEERIAVETAKIRAAILQSCEPGQLTELQYPGGALDAQADHANTCREQADAALSMIYAPSRPQTPAPVATCVAAASAYSRKLLRFVMRRKARTMERIGTRILTGSQKVALLQRVGRSLAAGEARWAAGLVTACPGFEEVYGRSAVGFVRTLKDRADCVLTATHGNNSLICIRQVCPNGIVEPGEECDDGNGNDADACSNSCRRNGSVVDQDR